jgi:DNA-binding response OmpR family regulator
MRCFIQEKIARGFGLRLLVVDDNEEITEAITVYCSADQNIECEVINDGPQVLENEKRQF